MELRSGRQVARSSAPKPLATVSSGPGVPDRQVPHCPRSQECTRELGRGLVRPGRRRHRRGSERRVLHHRRVMLRRRPFASSPATTSSMPPCGWCVVLAGVAAQYILAAAEFVAVSQVLVYIGAVMVLFLFGIMLTRAQIGAERDPQQPQLGDRHPSRPRPARSARVGHHRPVRRRQAARPRWPDADAGPSPTPCSPTTSSRSSPCRSSSSARRRWRHRLSQQGLTCSRSTPAARGGAVLRRRVWRARPSQRRDGADGGRVHPQRRQPQPRRLRLDDQHDRRPRLRPVRHRRSPPPRSASAWPMVILVYRNAARSPSTNSRDPPGSIEVSLSSSRGSTRGALHDPPSSIGSSALPLTR